jgi:hypothetical protein
MAHAFNPSTREAEAGRFLSLRPAGSTKWIPGQSGLYRETLSQKKKKKKERNKKEKEKKEKRSKRDETIKNSEEQNQNNNKTQLVAWSLNSYLKNEVLK